MKCQNYSNISNNLKKEETQLNSIFVKLQKDKHDPNSLKKFEQIMKSKIDFKNLLPCSKSFEGENLLTLSKLWMILILLKIKKGKSQQEDFLNLVNSSLTHDLNEYEEYRQFFEDQCEQIFTDEEAIGIINKNPRVEKELIKPSEHEEIRNNYIYLLFRPDYFKKVNNEEIPKIKKIQKSKSRTSNATKSEIESDEDEKGDRLDEKDMISKLRKNIKNKNSTNKKTREKEKDEEEEDDIALINRLINGKKKRGRKNQKVESENNTEEGETISDEEASKNKKNKNKKKEKEKEKEKEKNKYKKNRKNEKESEYEISEQETKEKKRPGRPKKAKKDNTKIDHIYDLLGLEKEEKSKEKSKRQSSSIPPKKKEKEIKKGKEKEEKGKKRSKSEYKEKKDKNKTDKVKKDKRRKYKDESSSEEEDEITSNLSDISDLFDNNKYEDDLDLLSKGEKKRMEKEIKAALEGKMGSIDIDEILESSKVEGISLKNFDSSSHDMDLDED